MNLIKFEMYDSAEKVFSRILIFSELIEKLFNSILYLPDQPYPGRFFLGQESHRDPILWYESEHRYAQF